MSESNLTPVIEAAERATAPVVLSGLDPYAPTFVSIPQGRELRELEIEKYLPQPRRKTGGVAFARADSFCPYVTRHSAPATDGRATLWADIDRLTVIAILNDHGDDGSRGWRDHRATLQLKATPAWKAWTALDREQLPQVAFAEFIEERITEIAEPSGADLLTIARSFQATKSADFRSDVRLDTGQVQLVWAETIEGKAGGAGAKGNIEIPSTFTLVMSPFEGYEPVTITARLRYRIREGTLTLGFHLDRLEDVVRDAFGQVAAEIETGTGIAVWYGTP